MSRFSESLEPKSHHMYRGIGLTFLGISLIVLVAIFYYTFSEATIIITPKSEEQKLSFEQSVEEGKREGGIRLLSVVKQEIQKFAATATESPDQKAKASGKVTLYNETNVEQALVATTRLLSESGVLYRLKDAVTIPANGSIEAVIVADKEGKDQEIGASSFTVPGLASTKQKVIYGKSSVATTGGLLTTYTITQKNFDDAKKSLTEQMKNNALSEVRSSVQAGEAILDNASVFEILKEQSEPAILAAASEFQLTLEGRLIVAVARKADLMILARQKLQGNFEEENMRFIGVNDESFQYEVQNFNKDSRVLTLKISVQGKAQINENSDILDKRKLMGLNEKEVKAYLENFSGIESVEVQFRPVWVKRIPKLADHITIQIQGN
ncbi:MAG: hypothetical protein HY453_02450 [Parcubacteria group bacterium]|nr:hypothetical protein [Parcubacteria group bacterium]